MKESAHIEMQWIVTVCRISVGSLCELGRLPHTLRYVRHAPLPHCEVLVCGGCTQNSKR